MFSWETLRRLVSSESGLAQAFIIAVAAFGFPQLLKEFDLPLEVRVSVSAAFFTALICLSLAGGMFLLSALVVEARCIEIVRHFRSERRYLKRSNVGGSVDDKRADWKKFILGRPVSRFLASAPLIVAISLYFGFFFQLIEATFRSLPQVFQGLPGWMQWLLGFLDAV